MTTNEMSNVSAEQTKLPVKIWFPDLGDSSNHSKYYIKVFPKGRSSSKGDGIGISVSENPVFFEKIPRDYGIKTWEENVVKRWIKDNLAGLRLVCERKLDIMEMMGNENYVKPKTKFELSSSKSETQATTGEFPSTVPASFRSPEPVAESFLQCARKRMLNKQRMEFGLPPVP